MTNTQIALTVLKEAEARHGAGAPVTLGLLIEVAQAIDEAQQAHSERMLAFTKDWYDAVSKQPIF